MTEDMQFTIGTNSFKLSDYHLKIENYTIGIPETKTTFQEIPYSNVVYDYTEYFGTPTYKQRPININCKLMKSTPCWQKIMDDILNIIHGQYCSLSFVSDSEWNYQGRVAVNTNEHPNWNYATISFTITCLPLKTNADGVSKL